MLVRRDVAALLIVAMIVATYAASVTAQGDQTKAKMFLQIAENAKEAALEFVESAKAGGKDVTAAVFLIGVGSNLLNQAKVAYEKGDYDSVVARARMAQEMFRDAFQALSPEKLSAEENEVRLLEAVERARRGILRIREVLSNSTEIAQDLRAQINSKLNQAEGVLNEAESFLKSNVKDASEAARELAQAEKVIAEVFVLMKYASKESSKRDMEAFLRDLERDISRLRDELEMLETKGVKVDDLNHQLDQAANLVKNAQEKASKDDLVGALADGESAGEIVENVKGEIVNRHGP
jgi:hypothetical protein